MPLESNYWPHVWCKNGSLIIEVCYQIEGRDVDDPPALEMGEPVGDAGEMSLYPTALETGGLLSLQSGKLYFC